MLPHHPDVTELIAVERFHRLRAAAARPAPGPIRRRLGSVLIAAGHRLHPEADRLRAVGPLDSAGPRYHPAPLA